MSRHTLQFILLALLLLLCLGLNLAIGSSAIPFSSLLDMLIGNSHGQEGVASVVWQIRVPKTLTATAAGGGLAIAGVLMQSLFRNPIAGPDITGVSAGAGLGVALFLFAGQVLHIATGSYSMVVAAIIGAVVIILPVMLMASRSQDMLFLIIMGITFSAVAGAIISILEQFGDQGALQRFTVWNNGSLGGVNLSQSGFLLALIMVMALLAWIYSSSLDAMLMGVWYARSMGVSVRWLRILIIAIAAIITGAITAYCGPLAFIGIAVPHLARKWLGTQQHRLLIPAALGIGMCLVLICDAFCYLPAGGRILPLNSLTSLVGAPIVVWAILKKGN